MSVSVSNVLEVLGSVLLLTAAGAWDWRALLALVGLVMVVVGFLLDPGEPDDEVAL